MSFLEDKILKDKVLNKEINIKVSTNDVKEKIFVEFSTLDGKLKIQKTFQTNHEGKKKSEEFSKSIKNLKDLRSYFGLNKKDK